MLEDRVEASQTAAILVLDIDGVLNTREEIDPAIASSTLHGDKVVRLNRILTETGARIVLASAWRYLIHNGAMTLAGMDWLLRSHGVLANRLVGITGMDTMVSGYPVPNERGTQIATWLASSGFQVSTYVVVDDQDLGISESGHPFVQTDYNVGLTEADADLAISTLLRERIELESNVAGLKSRLARR